MDNDEEALLRSVALSNANSILAARYRAEQELLDTKEALRGVAERLQLALSASQLGDWSWEVDTDRMILGERAATIFGLDGATSTCWTEFIDLVHDEDRHSVCAAIEKAMAECTDLAIEYRLAHPLGEPRWLSSVACCTYANDGTLLGMTGVVQDISERKRVDEAVRLSESRFRQLADAMPQVVWAGQPDGEVDYFNRRWYETTCAPEGFAGEESWMAVLHPDDLPKCRELWDKSIATGEPYQVEFRFKNRSGQYRWHLARALPARDDTGAITRWFGSSTDIDDQKRTEERCREETRILELLNKTGTAIGSTLDLQSLVQIVTDAATELSGAQFGAFFYNTVDARGEALALYTLSGAPREVFNNFDHPRATALIGATFRGEDPVRCDDVLNDPRYGRHSPHFGMPPGHLPVRSYLAVPVVSRSGEVIGGLFFGHSKTGVFTERAERLVVGVAGQAAVAIDNARLYEDVKQAAQEREALLEAERSARAEAERVNRIKDEFLATLSHELRTPLTAILGWSQVLQDGTNDAEKLKRGLDIIGRNARAQTQLIEDLLDMNRIVSGKVRLDIQSVDLAEVINAAIDAVRLSVEAKTIRLKAVLDPMAGTVSGDPSRLQQVIWNLLSNAVKFTPKGGRIEVLLERVSSHVEITIDDSGKGIDREFLPHIFDRFRQADASTTRAYGGLGLGLSIVKHLVELHGGFVRATSPGEQKGSTFVVTLPLPAVQIGKSVLPRGAASIAAVECEEISLANVKVLVVDDDPDARALIEAVLGHCKAQVTTAASADEALLLLGSIRPDVLISDIGMPEKDGYRFLREVRRLSPASGGRTPAVALTAFARSEDRLQAIKAGFQTHVSKPIEPQELVAIVGGLAGRVEAVSPVEQP